MSSTSTNKKVFATSPKHPTTKITANTYIVTVGFEVNVNTAFVMKVYTQQSQAHYSQKPPTVTREMTQILDRPAGGDYGHAFFYVTINNVVEAFFSFGPEKYGKDGWFNKGSASDENSVPNKWNRGALVKDGFATTRYGTANYPITEKVTCYRMIINQAQAQAIIQETNRIRGQIISGKQEYTAWINDTCAETAYDILKKYITNLPDGTGRISSHNFINLKAINPYMWNFNFSKSTFAKSKVIYPNRANKDGLGILEDAGYKLINQWFLRPGDKDPLVSEGYIK